MFRCGHCRIASVMLQNQSARFLSLAFGHVSLHSFLDKIRARSNAIISYSMFTCIYPSVSLVWSHSVWYAPDVTVMLWLLP